MRHGAANSRRKPEGPSGLPCAHRVVSQHAALVVIAGGSWGFAHIADEMGEQETRPFDQAMLNIFHPYADHARAVGPWWLPGAALDITSLGSLPILALFALIAAGFLVLKRRWREAGALAAGLAGGLILSETLKYVFERERPAAAYSAFEALNCSFPAATRCSRPGFTRCWPRCSLARWPIGARARTCSASA